MEKEVRHLGRPVELLNQIGFHSVGGENRSEKLIELQFGLFVEF